MWLFLRDHSWLSGFFLQQRKQNLQTWKWNWIDDANKSEFCGRNNQSASPKGIGYDNKW
jgi:hypothetical protein